MIDFVIPCHPKDFPSLALSVDGIKNNITSVNKIFVVAKKNPQLDDVIHIEEEKYSPHITKEGIKKIWSLKNPTLVYRSKWVYQQFLKLLTAKVIRELTESYVVVDSDTIFLRDVVFDKQKFYYCIAEEYHKPYLQPIKILLNTEKTIGFSCISHHMIFNKEKLNEMINFVEKSFDGESFSESILSILDYDEASCISEWDLYANYMLLNHPEICENRQLTWKDISYIPTEDDLKVLKNDYDFVSCHAYRRGIE